VYGQYDRKRRVQENIGLPDSLLSRFDLLFVVLDQLDPDSDRRIAAHVIRGHRYRNGNGNAGHDSDYDDDDEDNSDDEDEAGAGSSPKTHSIWQKSRYDSEKACKEDEDDDPHSDDVLQHEFLRKYLHFAKTRTTPVLTEEARECIAGRYAEMRSRQDERTLPVTARSLETVIRLASANAKARLSNVVEANPDVAAAMDILSFALYHENNDVVEDDGVNTNVATEQQRKRELPSVSESEDTENETADAKRSRTDDAGGKSGAAGKEEDPTMVVKRRIWEAVNRSDEGSLSIEEVCSDVKDRQSIEDAVKAMEEDGRVMYSDGVLYQVD